MTIRDARVHLPLGLLVGLLGCPSPPTVAPVVLDFDDGTFDAPVVTARSGETVTVTFRPQVAGVDAEPLSYRYDDFLTWTEPVANGDGTYSVDVTGTNHRNRGTLELYGCDVNGDAPCLPSGSITSTFVFMGETTTAIATPLDSTTPLRLAVGEVRPFAAWGMGDDDKPSYAPVAWTVSDPAVVSVDEAGVLTGVTAGEATLTASVEGISRSWSVTISEQPLGPPTEGAWPLADLALFEERASTFEVEQEINGKMGVRDGVPITVFRMAAHDSLVVAEWTGTGFGYELLAQYPTDRPARAKVRQQADGRPFVVYEGLLPHGVVVSTRAPDGGPWSHHHLPIIDNLEGFRLNPYRDTPDGYVFDIFIGRDDTVWIATHAQTHERSHPDCQRTYRLHQVGLRPAGGLHQEIADLEVDGSDVLVLLGDNQSVDKVLGDGLVIPTLQRILL
jgi:hypothetical protein